MLLAMNKFLYITLLPQKIQLKILLLYIPMIQLYWTPTLLFPMMKIILTCNMLLQALLQWKEVSMMTAQMRNQGQMPKRCLLLAPRLVYGQTQLCQKRGKEEICRGSPTSLPPLNQGNRGPMGDLYLLFVLQVLLGGGPRGGGTKNNHKKPPPPPKPKLKESHVKTATLIKSEIWLTTT